MKTKPKSLLVKTLAGFIFGGLVLAASFFLMPGDAVAIGGCSSPSCGPTQYTSTVTGVSNVDCEWAKMDANSRAQPQVNCGPDGECVNALEIVQACSLDGGLWKLRARVRYQCASC